jgi:hypothetical protein
MDKIDREYLKVISDIEQSGELLKQNLPPLWWGLFENCKNNGFTEQQAFELVKQYIHSTLSNMKNIGGK